MVRFGTLSLGSLSRLGSMDHKLASGSIPRMMIVNTPYECSLDQA